MSFVMAAVHTPCDALLIDMVLVACPPAPDVYNRTLTADAVGAQILNTVLAGV